MPSKKHKPEEIIGKLREVECQWAPKFPQKWALKIPYLVGWVRTVISRNRDRDWLSLVVVRGAYLGVD